MMNAKGPNETVMPKVLSCGVIMPISASSDYSAAHWVEVLDIFKEAVKSIATLQFSTPRLVSDRDDVGIIHKAIVQGIYNDDIVICDLSGRNPNVMFELGLRLAFDKATILVKDDKTEYAFDTSIIEHIAYPKDLHYKSINEFKNRLASKIESTYHESQKQGFSQFIRHFTGITPSKLNTEEGTLLDVVNDRFNELFREMTTIKQASLYSGSSSIWGRMDESRSIGGLLSIQGDTSRIALSVSIKNAINLLKKQQKTNFLDVTENNVFAICKLIKLDPENSIIYKAVYDEIEFDQIEMGYREQEKTVHKKN